jgi:hypothetical protein
MPEEGGVRKQAMRGGEKPAKYRDFPIWAAEFTTYRVNEKLKPALLGRCASRDFGNRAAFFHGSCPERHEATALWQECHKLNSSSRMSLNTRV